LSLLISNTLFCCHQSLVEVGRHSSTLPTWTCTCGT